HVTGVQTCALPIFIRAADSEEVYMSPLSVGVVPFNINRQARVLPAGLSSLPRIRPGDRLPLTLTTEDSSRAVLVAVDEGILQVAGFSTPDPLWHFLSKPRLQWASLQLLYQNLHNTHHLYDTPLG